MPWGNQTLPVNNSFHEMCLCIETRLALPLIDQVSYSPVFLTELRGGLQVETVWPACDMKEQQWTDLKHHYKRASPN